MKDFDLANELDKCGIIALRECPICGAPLKMTSPPDKYWLCWRCGWTDEPKEGAK